MDLMCEGGVCDSMTGLMWMHLRTNYTCTPLDCMSCSPYSFSSRHPPLLSQVHC